MANRAKSKARKKEMQNGWNYADRDDDDMKHVAAQSESWRFGWSWKKQIRQSMQPQPTIYAVL